MRLIRICSDANDHSRFDEFELPLRPDTLGKSSEFLPATNVFLRELRRDLVNDLHCAPRRQLIFIISGKIGLESSRGALAEVKSGEAIFVEDVSGRGHVTRVVDGPTLCVYVPVPDDLQLELYARTVAVAPPARRSHKDVHDR